MKFLSMLVALLCYTMSLAAEVVDGDTLKLNGATYRIDGIDAPEYGQKCGKWQCGKSAVEEMARLVEGKNIHCDAISSDGYGRTIATCYANGVDLGAEMVRSGFAWAFVKHSTRYLQEEREAKDAQARIWKGKFQPLWDYRAAKWAVAEQTAPVGCPIKGNISRNGMIYHPPWSPWYSRTKIDETQGERWFCSESDAVAAGWRAPKCR